MKACPDVKSAEVEIKAGKNVSITLEIRTEKELAPTFERVMQMPELQDLRPELQFKIMAP